MRVQGTAVAGSRLIDVRRPCRPLRARRASPIPCSSAAHPPRSRNRWSVVDPPSSGARHTVPRWRSCQTRNPDRQARPPASQGVANSISILGFSRSSRWSALHYIASRGTLCRVAMGDHGDLASGALGSGSAEDRDPGKASWSPSPGTASSPGERVEPALVRSAASPVFASGRGILLFLEVGIAAVEPLDERRGCHRSISAIECRMRL